MLRAYGKDSLHILCEVALLQKIIPDLQALKKAGFIYTPTT